MAYSLEHSIDDAIRSSQLLKEKNAQVFIQGVIERIVACYRAGNKVLIAGNGGSLCDAMHFAEELTGYFREKRKALPAIALSDPGHLTCVANDVGFDTVFARAIEAHGKKEDIFISLTTSGHSENLVQAVSEAKRKGLITIGFLGKGGGKIKGMCDLEWVVPGFRYSDRIQEAHMTAIHIIIEGVEHELFYSKKISDEQENEPRVSASLNIS